MAPDRTRQFARCPAGCWLMYLMGNETEKVLGTFTGWAVSELGITMTFPSETQTQPGIGVWALHGCGCFMFTPHCTYQNSLPASQMVHGCPRLQQRVPPAPCSEPIWQAIPQAGQRDTGRGQPWQRHSRWGWGMAWLWTLLGQPCAWHFPGKWC